MSDMTSRLNDLSYIPPNNEQNEPTLGDIGETSNEPTQAKRSEFEELFDSANEELYPGCDFMTRLEFMAKFTHLKVKGPDNKDMQFCPMCKTRRWKDNNTTGKKVPKKHDFGKSTENGKMQHPIDGKSWKNYDTRYPGFAVEPRNVQLGLAADDFNKFGNLSQSYSIPKSTAKDIDVYLRPLIDDLKDLCALKGVETIDATTGKTFNMRAMLL
ncbi:reverse transcriptase domain-containing protein [Tanacetum coccineum]